MKIYHLSVLRSQSPSINRPAAGLTGALMCSTDSVQDILIQLANIDGQDAMATYGEVLPWKSWKGLAKGAAWNEMLGLYSLLLVRPCGLTGQHFKFLSCLGVVV